MLKKSNVFCIHCATRLTKENSRKACKSDRPGYVYPDCKNCLSIKKIKQKARRQFFIQEHACSI